MIVSTGNQYIIQVKANQKKLLEQIEVNTGKEEDCVDFHIEENRKSGRYEKRETYVYKNLSGISEDWCGLKRLIRIERTVSGKRECRHETAYYISSIRSNQAFRFAKHIRGHWGIENRLHWVKDVIMKEDDSKIRKGNAPENFSILKNIVCNIFRANGHHSIKHAMEAYANNFKELFELTNSKIKKYKIT